MENTELMRYKKAKDDHADDVAKHDSWLNSVATDNAFDHMRDGIEKLRLYEKQNFDIKLLQINIEHCERKIDIGKAE